MTLKLFVYDPFKTVPVTPLTPKSHLDFLWNAMHSYTHHCLWPVVLGPMDMKNTPRLSLSAIVTAMSFMWVKRTNTPSLYLAHFCTCSHTHRIQYTKDLWLVLSVVLIMVEQIIINELGFAHLCYSSVSCTADIFMQPLFPPFQLTVIEPMLKISFSGTFHGLINLANRAQCVSDWG